MLDECIEAQNKVESSPFAKLKKSRFELSLEEMIESYEKSQPVRKIKANRRSITGWINGFPTHDPVPFESSIERDCAYQLMFDKRVKSVQSQPLTITFDENTNGDRFYTPDYLVEYKTDDGVKKILIECKPEEYWRKHEVKLLERYKYVGNWAQQRGMRFSVLLDTIVQDTALENIKLLYPHLLLGIAGPEGRADLQPQILKALPASNYDVLNAVVHQFPNIESAQTEILEMLANGQIVCDMNMRLDMNTVLHKPGSDWSPEFLFDRGIEFGE